MSFTKKEFARFKAQEAAEHTIEIDGVTLIARGPQGCGKTRLLKRIQDMLVEPAKTEDYALDASDEDKAKRDMRLFGQCFRIDGKRVAPDRVTVSVAPPSYVIHQKLIDTLQMAKHVVEANGTGEQLQQVFDALESAGVKP